MPAYMVVQINITDPDKFAKYREAVLAVVESFGGRYIARGAQVEILEGSHDGRRLVLFEFPSMDAIRRFWNSPEYAKVKPLRENAAEIDVWAVPGVESGRG
jgi:uncharacterized protein (DUF1330 family)